MKGELKTSVAKSAPLPKVELLVVYYGKPTSWPKNKVLTSKHPPYLKGKGSGGSPIPFI